MADETPSPKWFDPKLHVTTDGGVMERATGLLLAEDGLPRYSRARAVALAKSGISTDPLGHVDADFIALAKPAAPPKPATAAAAPAKE